MKGKLWLVVALLVTLWLATALRYHRLDAQSFWNDEGNSARLSERSITLIIEGTASDIHPPLYYLMLHGWRSLLGDSEFALRAMSAFSGVVVVTAIYSVGQILSSGVAVPLLAALLAAVHPTLVYYSQEARMYELLALWSVLATALLLHWMVSGPGRDRRRLWLAFAYTLVTVAGLYTHYFYPAVLAAHGTMLLLLIWFLLSGQHAASQNVISRVWKPMQYWVVMVLAALFLYLPWLPIFLRQAGGRSADELPPLLFLEQAGRWLLFGGTLGEASVWQTIAAATMLLTLVLSVVLALRQGRARGDSEAHGRLPFLLPLSMIVVPVALMLLAGTTREAYFKFMLVSVPFLPLLVAHVASRVWSAGSHVPLGRLLLAVVSIVLLAIVLTGSSRSLANLYYDPTFARDDYRGIARRIEAAGHPNDAIILNAANQWEVFTYYHRDGAPVYPIPRGRPDEQQVAAELAEITARHDRLYALFWGEAERDPQRLVERWLDAHAFKAQEEWVGDVRFVTYAVPPEPAQEMEMEAGVTFGDGIRLLGYTVQGNPLAAGDIIQVTLYWQASQTPAERYKVFLHLLDQQGNLVAQRDAEPGGNMALTTEWAPGETVVDNHGVLAPPELSPGRYELYVGLYPLADPQQRLTFEEQGEVGDRYHLATITVQ